MDFDTLYQAAINLIESYLPEVDFIIDIILYYINKTSEIIKIIVLYII